MKGNEKKPMKVYCVTLSHLWQQGYQLRINNIADRTKKAHPEQDILAQVWNAPPYSSGCRTASDNVVCFFSFAQIKYASKCQMVFHNSQHFCEFCRYGDRPQDSRKRQVSALLKRFEDALQGAQNSYFWAIRQGAWRVFTPKGYKLFSILLLNCAQCWMLWWWKTILTV